MKLSLSTLFLSFACVSGFASVKNDISLGVSEKYLSTLQNKPTLHEGMKLPNVVFKTRVRTQENNQEFKWKDVSIKDLFDGKKCVLFAIPGAFTPTCSTFHLPGFIKAHDKLKDVGVDKIYCLSVNDAFVLQKWGEMNNLAPNFKYGELPFEKVNFIPDGACKFTRAINMNCIWDHERGFGERSWRYSAFVDNGVVKKLFLEKPKKDNSKLDPFVESDAKTMVSYLYNFYKKPISKQELNSFDCENECNF